jgi:hypothetical protein
MHHAQVGVLQTTSHVQSSHMSARSAYTALPRSCIPSLEHCNLIGLCRNKFLGATRADKCYWISQCLLCALIIFCALARACVLAAQPLLRV